jgi:hypothetical protein
VTLQDLNRAADATELVQRLGGEHLVAVLRRLGFWVAGAAAPPAPRVFPTQVSQLSGDRLGDEHAFWASELSRAHAVVGALRGLRARLDHELKRRRNSAAAQLLRDARAADLKAPTKSQIDIEVADKTQVKEIESQVADLEVLIASLEATRDALDIYVRVLSREITRRGDLFRSGVSR